MPNIDDAPISYQEWRRRQEREGREEQRMRRQEEMDRLRNQMRIDIEAQSPVEEFYGTGDWHFGGATTRTISLAELDRMYRVYMPPKKSINQLIAEQRSIIRTYEAKLMAAKEKLFDLQKEVDDDD